MLDGSLDGSRFDSWTRHRSKVLACLWVGLVAFALAVAFAVVTMGTGGSAGQGYGDNPNHEKGSMSGDIARDCTNFSATASGVVRADCNASTDPAVDPSATKIDLGGGLHVQNVGEGRRQERGEQHGLPHWWSVYYPTDLTITWTNGGDYSSRWKNGFGDACTNARTYYDGGNIYLEADCALREKCVPQSGWLPRNCGPNETRRSPRTRLNDPDLGGGLMNSNGNLVLK